MATYTVRTVSGVAGIGMAENADKSRTGSGATDKEAVINAAIGARVGAYDVIWRKPLVVTSVESAEFRDGLFGGCGGWEVVCSAESPADWPTRIVAKRVVLWLRDSALPMIPATYQDNPAKA